MVCAGIHALKGPLDVCGRLVDAAGGLLCAMPGELRREYVLHASRFAYNMVPTQQYDQLECWRELLLRALHAALHAL